MQKINKNIHFTTLSLILSVIISMFSVIAAQDFSVSPTSLSISSLISGTYSTYFIVTSNIFGLNLNFSNTNLTDGTNFIPLSLNRTSYTNLSNSSTLNISVSIANVGNNVGTFTGNITVTNSDNITDFVIIPVTLTVTQASTTGASLIIIDCDGVTDLDFEMEVDVDKDTENYRFCLKNNGNVPLRNILIRMPTKFDGDNEDINDDRFEINGEDGDNTFSLDDDFNGGNPYILNPGQISDKIRFTLNVPSNLDPDTYKGNINFEASNGSNVKVFDQNYLFKINAYSNDEDVFMQKNSLYVRNGVLEIKAEPGEIADNYDIRVENNAGFDVFDMKIELETDLKEENSNNKILKSWVSFSPSIFDLDRSDEDDIEVIVDIPDDQPVGTYSANLKLISSTGRQLGDKIELKVKVIGDIYIDSINYNSQNIKPGDNLDVKIKVVNSGSQIERSIRVLGSLYDIDSANSDIHESSSTFLLASNEEREEVLRFKIPKDATDGSHTLEIRVQYSAGELLEVESIDVQRPTHKIEILSSAINPGFVKCDDSIYTYIKFQNLGKYDEDVKVRAEILGQNIFEETNLVELGTDDILQKNLVLDISKLKAGNYEVQQKIIYSNNLFVIVKDTLKVEECKESSVGVNIKEINQTLGNQSTVNSTKNSISILGNEYPSSTIYLGGGVLVVFILIIISLFFL